MVKENIPGPVDCACVIHGDGYSWDYVDRLYNMLSRHITPGIRLHVYTEEHREVPAPYIKHSLLNWGFGGPKRSWWYKLQVFNTAYHCGPLLYFDLDTVIVDNIDWVWKSSLNYFWTVRDFKHLWKPSSVTVNSSIMWFDTQKFDYIWKDFKSEDINKIVNKYHGDQDYITEVVPDTQRRFFDQERVKSWRWQCVDGGYDFQRKRHLTPNTGTFVAPPTSILIFHGKPKPDAVADPVIFQHWQ
jgi:hypothetical protein